jgi:acetylglutamate kinase
VAEGARYATRFVRGLRVTDAASLKVVVAVLGGLINKELVAALNARGGRVSAFGVDVVLSVSQDLSWASWGGSRCRRENAQQCWTSYLR